MADLRIVAQALFNALSAYYPEGAEHAVGCNEKLHAKAANPKAARCRDTDYALKLAEEAGLKPEAYCNQCHQLVGQHHPGSDYPVLGKAPLAAPLSAITVPETPKFVTDSGGPDAQGNEIVGFGSAYGKH